jgi:hypothetical protein
VKSSPVHIILCAMLLLSCSPEKEGQQGVSLSPEKTGISESESEQTLSEGADEKSYSLKIHPRSAYRDTPISAYPKNFTTADAQIEWTVNGVSIPGEGAQLKPGSVTKGNTVQARARVNKREVLSNVVRIINSPPQISSVQILPEVFKPGDTLFVEVETGDADGDEVALSYEWMKNREPAGSGRSISAGLRRGDTVFVRITPYDGEAYGRAMFVERKIQNMPPMIVEDNVFTFDGEIYSFRVRATDPDEDPLSYSLKSGPDGMSINAETGDVTWPVPQDFVGEVPVTVAVSDGVRGETTRELTLIIEQPEEQGAKE